MYPDAELGSQPGSHGPFEHELDTCNSEKAVGLVAGAYRELPGAFHDITGSVASQDGHQLPPS